MRRLIGATGASALLLIACTTSGDEAAEPLVVAPPTAAPSVSPRTQSETTKTANGDASDRTEANPTMDVVPTSVPASDSTLPSEVPATTTDTTGSTASAPSIEGADEPPPSTFDAPADDPAAAPDLVPPVADAPSTPSATRSAPLAANVASSGGPSVDPVALVGAANLVLSTTTTTTANAACGSAASDLNCTAAGVPPRPPTPNPGVSAGEYQRNVSVDTGARLDVYFDQTRPLGEMQQICGELGGGFTQRLDDGSPWAGWFYCEDVDH